MTAPERKTHARLQSLGCTHLAALVGCTGLVYAAWIAAVVWVAVAALRMAGVEL